MTDSFSTTQNWDLYSQENHETWEILFQACREKASLHMCSDFLQGLTVLDLPSDRIPSLKDLSDRLKSISGWEIVPVPALVPDDVYFGLMAEKKFPVNVNIRGINEIDFVEFPDLFHDIFGHIPLLIAPKIESFIQHCGALIKDAILSKSLSKLNQAKRLYWYTMEVGFVRENDEVKILGSAIASSTKEITRSLTVSPRRFTLDDVTNTPFDITAVQQTYFCLDDISVLGTIRSAQAVA